MNLNYGLWRLFCINMVFFGFRRNSSKIHDRVNVVQIDNEMKSYGVKICL